jgi:hypothetical protein
MGVRYSTSGALAPFFNGLGGFAVRDSLTLGGLIPQGSSLNTMLMVNDGVRSNRDKAGM